MWNMPNYRQTRIPAEETRAAKRRYKSRVRLHIPQKTPPSVYRQAVSGTSNLSPTGVSALQRAAGNRATNQLLSRQGGAQSQIIQRTMDDLEELPCPGSKIRSEGRGRDLGIGQGKGPIGTQTEEDL